MRILILILPFILLFGQESDNVTYTFISNRLINQSTNEQLYAKTFEFRVGHRFGDVASGYEDFWGLDLGANTTLGMDFALTDFLKFGAARSNLGKTIEFNSQIALLHQKRDNSMPFHLSVLAAFSSETQYQFEEKYSLYQIILSRRINKDFSVLLAPYYVQRYENEKRRIGAQPAFGATIAARFKVSKRNAVIFELSQMLNRGSYNENSDDSHKLKYNSFSIGYNVESAGHSFQIFISNTQETMLTQTLLGTNANMGENHFYLGFNITRLFTLD